MKTNGDENYCETDINDGSTSNRQTLKESQEGSNTGRCYKEFAYHEDSNLKFRNAMEDFPKVVEDYLGDKNKAFFSLYDGHGGSEPVIYVKDRMPVLFQECLEHNQGVEIAMVNAFDKIDEELKSCDSENTGCTACVVYICVENGRRVLYCANVGDTRCVLVTSEDVNTLTQDHKCSVTSEVKRVREGGGVILSGRVFGQLVLTRALGDLALKGYGVIPTPHVIKIEIEERHKYVVLASDGVWDVMKNEDVLKLSKDVVNVDDFSKNLVMNSVKEGSRDNISCIVIRLN
jgi:serine/threonine protein phosphatase PrpC